MSTPGEGSFLTLLSTQKGPPSSLIWAQKIPFSLIQSQGYGTLISGAWQRKIPPKHTDQTNWADNKTTKVVLFLIKSTKTLKTHEKVLEENRTECVGHYTSDSVYNACNV